MLTRIQARHYRCLRSIDQSVAPFQVLVGANASGKSTFLDVVSLLGAILSKGLDEAIAERASDFRDLVWNREGPGFELAVEARIPERLRAPIKMT